MLSSNAAVRVTSGLLEAGRSGFEGGRSGYLLLMTSDKELHKGDKVSWKTHGTTTEGTVQEKITSETDAAGRTVKADKDNPQYLVESDKSGRDAVHKPEALQKKGK